MRPEVGTSQNDRVYPSKPGLYVGFAATVLKYGNRLN